MIDELTPVATYMAHEMNVNANGADCRKMATLNAVSSKECVAQYFKARWWQKLFGTLSPAQCVDIEISSHQAALMMWAFKVMQGSDWDHKPKIFSRFVSATNKNGAWHRYGVTDYYYDVWSNIHYGYVGAAARFDQDVLLDGAGLEQIGTDLLRRRWPTRSFGVQGLRAFDNESDRAAITLGIDLFRTVPTHLSGPNLVQAILGDAALETRSAPAP